MLGAAARARLRKMFVIMVLYPIPATRSCPPGKAQDHLPHLDRPGMRAGAEVLPAQTGQIYIKIFYE